MNSKRIRALLLLVVCFLSSAFERLYLDSAWKGVSRATPVIYLKPTDDLVENLVISYIDLPDDDPLVYLFGPELNKAILRRVGDEFNSVSTSYLRVGYYGEDLANSGEAFSVESAKTKSVDMKLEKFANPFIGAQAQTVYSGKYVTGCQISLDKTRAYSAKEVLHLLVHEVAHCAGLGHSHGDKHSILAYDSPFDNYHLGADDKVGLTKLYPAAAEMAKPKQTFGLTSCSLQK